MLTQTITATFDGKFLRPDKPLNLKPNIRYVVTIQSAELKDTQEDSWDVLEGLIGTVDAPSDWSVEHDHYLYGTPKRESPTEK